ncbi:MAG: integrase arm-type DNA-binding domain-containing protein [Gammaproteobacteria bacterium]|nr:integrase arm-type DNA-binding domain-containing protein [Gammaproteobacteria bacterium]
MPLTDIAIRAAKPAAKPIRLFDSGGLYLEVSPGGGKWWRLKYRVDGKEKRLSLGVYPDVNLKEARERRDASRKLLSQGVDPGKLRKATKAMRADQVANSFEAVAREWYLKHRDVWATGHSEKIISRLERDVFPWLGGMPITDISARDVLEILRRIEARGALDTAHRARGTISQIIRYAIATGRAERDPCPDLRGALPPAKETNFPSITDPEQVGELLRALDAFRGTFVVHCALHLSPLLFVRPGELRKAEWSAIDLDKAEWRYIVSKTKTDHSVPLSTQSVRILRDLHAMTGRGRYVFPGRNADTPMSEATVNAALRRLGYDTKTEITGHGFRAMARTILHEVLHVRPEIIEHQLAHKVPDILGTAYNRTKFIKERRVMMQQWADYLEELKSGAGLAS